MTSSRRTFLSSLLALPAASVLPQETPVTEKFSPFVQRLMQIQREFADSGKWKDARFTWVRPDTKEVRELIFPAIWSEESREALTKAWLYGGAEEGEVAYFMERLD